MSHDTWVIVLVVSLIAAGILLGIGFDVGRQDTVTFRGPITGIRRGDILTSHGRLYRVVSVHAPNRIVCIEMEDR